MTVLNVLIVDDVREHVKGKRSVDSILDTLLQHEYPQSNYRKYLRELQYIKQDYFKTIHNYYWKDKIVCKKFYYCRKIHPNEIISKIEDVFALEISHFNKNENNRIE